MGSVKSLWNRLTAITSPARFQLLLGAQGNVRTTTMKANLKIRDVETF